MLSMSVVMANEPVISRKQLQFFVFFNFLASNFAILFELPSQARHVAVAVANFIKPLLGNLSYLPAIKLKLKLFIFIKLPSQCRNLFILSYVISTIADFELC